MIPVIKISPLKPSAWKQYRDLRIQAIRTDPLAFGSTLAETLKITPKEWKERLADKERYTLFASVDGELVGMLIAFLNTNPRSRHNVNLGSFYVRSEYRRMHIGSLLFERMLAELKKKSFVRKLNLQVGVHQKAAIALYRRYGFKIVGTLKNEDYFKRKYHDDYIMEKYV